MYLEHFHLKKLPFALTPNTEFFCELPGHQAALNVLLVSLRAGEGFIKIVGEVGSGKTLLCRKLLNSLNENEFLTAYIPNPDLTPVGLRKAIVRELGVDISQCSDPNDLLDILYERLLELHSEGKRVVLIIDEAQALTEECMEAIRLLTNLETESTKLLHVVLFGQPELEKRLQQPSLRQLKQRISFSYDLLPLKRQELDDYLHYRLVVAGYNYGPIFTEKACDLLYKASHGIPRVINILCHKALMAAYGRGQRRVDWKMMNKAVTDTTGSSAFAINWQKWQRYAVLTGSLLLVVMGSIFVKHKLGM